jgi:thiol-disulfide isomerase/thioredoxin
MFRARIRAIFAISAIISLAGCSANPRLSDFTAGDPISAPISTLEPPMAAAEIPEAPRPKGGSVYRSSSFDSEESIEPEVAVPAKVPNSAGTPAPPFVAETLSGGHFDLAAQRGKVVVLDYWRESCGPCLKAMSKVVDLRRRYSKDQVEIVGINTDERKATARAYLRSHPHDWDQIHARSQTDDLLGMYRIQLLPHFVVIDRQGNMRYRGGDVDTAAAKVAELVEGPSPDPSHREPIFTHN